MEIYLQPDEVSKLSGVLKSILKTDETMSLVENNVVLYNLTEHVQDESVYFYDFFSQFGSVKNIRFSGGEKYCVFSSFYDGLATKRVLEYPKEKLRKIFGESASIGRPSHTKKYYQSTYFGSTNGKFRVLYKCVVCKSREMKLILFEEYRNRQKFACQHCERAIKTRNKLRNVEKIQNFLKNFKAKPPNSNDPSRKVILDRMEIEMSIFGENEKEFTLDESVTYYMGKCEEGIDVLLRQLRKYKQQTEENLSLDDVIYDILGKQKKKKSSIYFFSNITNFPFMEIEFVLFPRRRDRSINFTPLKTCIFSLLYICPRCIVPYKKEVSCPNFSFFRNCSCISRDESQTQPPTARTDLECSFDSLTIDGRDMEVSLTPIIVQNKPDGHVHSSKNDYVEGDLHFKLYEECPKNCKNCKKSDFNSCVVSESDFYFRSVREGFIDPFRTILDNVSLPRDTPRICPLFLWEVSSPESDGDWGKVFLLKFRTLFLKSGIEGDSEHMRMLKFTFVPSQNKEERVHTFFNEEFDRKDDVMKNLSGVLSRNRSINCLIIIMGKKLHIEKRKMFFQCIKTAFHDRNEYENLNFVKFINKDLIIRTDCYQIKNEVGMVKMITDSKEGIDEYWENFKQFELLNGNVYSGKYEILKRENGVDIFLKNLLIEMLKLRKRNVKRKVNVFDAKLFD